MLPAKADPEKQKEYLEKEMESRLEFLFERLPVGNASTFWVRSML